MQITSPAFKRNASGALGDAQLQKALGNVRAGFIDKRRSVRLGLHTLPADDMMERAIRPQEAANRHDTRFAEIRDGDGNGLRVVGLDRFDLNVCPYSPEELAAVSHDFLLQPSGKTVVVVDFLQSGVGSNSCGPALLPRYRLNRQRFRLTFRLEAL